MSTVLSLFAESDIPVSSVAKPVVAPKKPALPAPVTAPRYLEAGATFDFLETHRYSLVRVWSQEGPRICWCMLNPSTADATEDDQTIDKVVKFSKAWGFGSLEVVNLPYVPVREIIDFTCGLM